MACTSKPQRRHDKRFAAKYRANYQAKVKQFKPGLTVRSCGGVGTILKMGKPYRAPYMMYGSYYNEYDLLIRFDDGSESWHGLVDCTEFAK